MSKKLKLFGNKDVDLEHSERMIGKNPPPRIINPYQLQSYGIQLPALGHLWSLMTGVIDGVKKIDVLKGWCAIQSNPGTPDGQDLWTPHGRIYFQIDIDPGKYFKTVKWVGDLPRAWIVHFYMVFYNVIESYAQDIYPFHLHFIVKDSLICPSPIPYMEFFISSEKPTKGNLMADLNFLDINAGLSSRKRQTVV